jgi:lysophospholipase L1-like esterase
MNKIKVSKRMFAYISVTVALALAVAVLSVLLYFAQNPTSTADYYDRKCEVFKLENANFAHGQTVFIGDSLTDGCALDVFYPELSTAAYNRGIGGDCTAGVLKRLEFSLFDIKPSRIVLMIGINDINGMVPNSIILDNYSKILSEIKTALPEAEVYCVSVMPVNKELESYTVINAERTNSIVLEINPEIEALTKSYGYHFVNLHADFCDADGFLNKELSPDGIHLNHDGYTVYSKIIKRALND